ncbi:MAG: hypothetical protein FJW35_03685 [Acidobacteria bacterium]|nr:hypothetical protein [Acidobacteriota bacterium]
MPVLDSLALAVFFCVITMLCRGSRANTQKPAEKEWRFELFYWDCAIGVVPISSVLALTMGSSGSQGRRFLEDLGQAHSRNLISALVGDAVFDAANIPLVAAIDIGGALLWLPSTT